MAPQEFPNALLAALQDLEEVLPLQEDLGSTITKIAEVTVRLVDGCDSASVTIQEDGDVSTPGASDHVALMLDQAQYGSGRGPCLDAAEHGQIFVVADMNGEPRWPEFSKVAVEQGVLSSLSVPIKTSTLTGGLNLYGRSVDAFKDAPKELTDLIAKRASIAIENATVYGATKALVEQLNEAIKTRELIGEAKGLLMAREGVSEDEAFQMLVTVSQNTNTKLREIAQKIVDDAHNGGR
jgi:GAF domain-containing protein